MYGGEGRIAAVSTPVNEPWSDNGTESLKQLDRPWSGVGRSRIDSTVSMSPEPEDQRCKSESQKTHHTVFFLARPAM